MKMEADWKEPYSKESNTCIWNWEQDLGGKFGSHQLQESNWSHHPRSSAGCKQKTVTEILIPGTGEEGTGKRKAGRSSQVHKHSNWGCHEMQSSKEQAGITTVRRDVWGEGTQDYGVVWICSFVGSQVTSARAVSVKRPRTVEEVKFIQITDFSKFCSNRKKRGP